MVWDAAQAREQLRQAGLRVTGPRLAVLRVLSNADRPLSQTEVFERLGDEPHVDKATVYRNLIALSDGELARVATQVGGVTRFELTARDDSREHPHFLCSKCGGVSCLPAAEIPLPKRGAWAAAMRNAAVQFVGDCPDCAAKG